MHVNVGVGYETWTETMRKEKDFLKNGGQD